MDQDEQLRKLLKKQQEVGNSIFQTSDFLRFVLSLSAQNLRTIQTQLEDMRDLVQALGDTNTDAVGTTGRDV